MKKKYDVVAISQAIVDLFAKVDMDFFEEHGIQKGTTTHVDKATSDGFLSQLEVLMKCAGSAPVNTLSAMSALGGKCALISRICKDDLGEIFKKSLDEQGIDFSHGLCDKGMGTGRCISLITEDNDRTMITYLGTAHEFSDADMDESLVLNAEYILFEAYQFESPNMLRVTEKALAKAKEGGAKIVLGAANPACLLKNRDLILRFIEKYVDIFIGNENEVRSVFCEGEHDMFSPEILLDHLQVCIVTRGAEGSLVFARGEDPLSFPAPDISNIVDTTGAGDHYLGGFLYALTRGYPLQKCVDLATKTSGAMLSELGARARTSLAYLYHDA